MVNKVILVGNVGQDPESKQVGDSSVVKFSIATSESWKDKNSGERKTDTEWHTCEAWGKLAEIIQQWVKKGSKIYIEGSIKTEKYTDKEGIEKRFTKIKVSSMKMMGDGGNASAPKPKQLTDAPPVLDENGDDDLPF